MSFKRCPGSSSFSQPKPDIVPCTQCGQEVEIWSDEATGKCRECGTVVIRTETQSCVDWCKYARECLGDEKYRRYGEMKAAMRKPAIIDAVLHFLGGDESRMEMPKKTVSYAEAIIKEEQDYDPNLIIAASLMYSLSAEDCRSVLRDLEYPAPFSDQAAAMITGRETATQASETNTKVLHDAVLLAVNEGSVTDELPDRMLTIKGRRIARELSRG